MMIFWWDEFFDSINGNCYLNKFSNLFWPRTPSETLSSFFFKKLRTNIKINTRQFFNTGTHIHLRNQPRQRESNSEA